MSKNEDIDCDPNLLDSTHIIVCDLRKAATIEEKVKIYIKTLDEISRLATIGGAIMGGKRTTVDILSVECLEERTKLYNSFPKFFVVRIIEKIGDEDVTIDFAVTKADIYFFAYKIGVNGKWFNCSGIKYLVKGALKANFSVSYTGKDSGLTSMLGMSIISQALEGLKRGVMKSGWFHAICKHFAEPCRFKNIRDEILEFMNSDSCGYPSEQFNLCVNNWWGFSNMWRRYVYRKEFEEKDKKKKLIWKVPISIQRCLPPLDNPEDSEEEVEDVEDPLQKHLWKWTEKNLLVLKCENLDGRRERYEYFVPSRIRIPKSCKLDRTIRDRNQLNSKREEFWNVKIAEAPDLSTKDGWLTMKEIARHVLSGPHQEAVVQLHADNADLLFPKDSDLLCCQHFNGYEYTLEDYLLVDPKNIK